MRLPPRPTRTYTLVPYTTLCRSAPYAPAIPRRRPSFKSCVRAMRSASAMASCIRRSKAIFQNVMEMLVGKWMDWLSSLSGKRGRGPLADSSVSADSFCFPASVSPMVCDWLARIEELDRATPPPPLSLQLWTAMLAAADTLLTQGVQPDVCLGWAPIVLFGG